MPSDTPTVLIVDDVPTNRTILERMLQKREVRVITATHGREALDLLATEPVDVILLDVMMPVMNGYEVLEALRERPYIPVVVISALHEVESMARCIELGAVDFLFKPVNWLLLDARLQACLNQKALYDREQAAYREATQANRAKSEFVSMVSHELKNPLTAIIGYADMLLNGSFGPVAPDQVECLQAMSALSKSMAHMLGDLNDLSLIEAGQLQLEIGSYDLPVLVAKAHQSVQYAMNRKNQRFTPLIDATLAPVMVDAPRVVQILTNLLSNASKYTAMGGAITLNAYSRDAQTLEIAISDTGIGLRDEDQRRIFERYFRSRDEMAQQEPGTGLGLSITRLLVEALGGSIWFESVYRQGTTFYITLPAASATPQVVALPE